MLVNRTNLDIIFVFQIPYASLFLTELILGWKKNDEAGLGTIPAGVTMKAKMENELCVCVRVYESVYVCPSKTKYTLECGKGILCICWSLFYKSKWFLTVGLLWQQTYKGEQILQN